MTADPSISVAIILVKSLTLVLGALITYLAFKAYRRTGGSSLRSLAIGFGIVTLGSALAGVANQVLGVSLPIGVLLQSLLTALGFAVITYSLYAD
jgi:heme A synthase